MPGPGNDYIAVLFRRARSSRRIGQDTAAAFLESLRRHGVDTRRDARLEERVLDADRVLEVRFGCDAPLEQLRRRSLLAAVEEELELDAVIQPARPQQRRPVKLAVFDMDSTLIQQEVIDLLAGHAGVEAAVADITSRAMNGELDFSASLRERVGLLEGIPDTVFHELRPRLTLTPGAPGLLKCLKAAGAKTALLSGGFMPLATYIAAQLGIDHVHANELAVEDGKLTGKLQAGCAIVNAEKKRELLHSIASSEGVADGADVMAVGDGANDLLMLSAAGLGIAVNAKPRVQELAPCRLNCSSLADVLHVLGYTADDIARATR